MGLVDVAYRVSRAEVEGNRRLAGSLEAWADKIKSAKKEKAKKTIYELVSAKKIPIKELAKKIDDAGLDVEEILPTLDQLNIRRLQAGMTEATPEVLNEIYSAKGNNVDMRKILAIGARHGLGPMDTVTLLSTFNKTGLLPGKEKPLVVNPGQRVLVGGKEVFFNKPQQKVMSIGGRPYNPETGQYGKAPPPAPQAPVSEFDQAKQNLGLIEKAQKAGITETSASSPLGAAVQQITGKPVAPSVVPVGNRQNLPENIQPGTAENGMQVGAPVAMVEPGRVNVPQAPQSSTGQITPKILLDKIQQVFIQLQQARRGVNQYMENTNTTQAIKELEQQLYALVNAYRQVGGDRREEPS
jgi:hypothetical protein